jgi:predicted enzyme related to lactoylglutathione lyase
MPIRERSSSLATYRRSVAVIGQPAAERRSSSVTMGLMASIFNITMVTCDVSRLGAFWAAALHMDVMEERSDLLRLADPTRESPNLLLLHSDDPTNGGSRVHLDLAARDVDAETQRLVGLGAELVDGGTAKSPNTRSANGVRWVVLQDPDGNELCLGGYPDGGTPRS